MPEHNPVLVLRPGDDVAIALKDLKAGVRVEASGCNIELRSNIPRIHKFALRSIRAGEPVRKYGQIIGIASAEIQPGEHVHVHNLKFEAFKRDYAMCSEIRPVDFFPLEKRRTFEGYLRSDGRVGTRNYLVLLPSVNCSASVATFVVERFRQRGLRDFPNVDGIVALSHGSGCAIASSGETFDQLQRTLVGAATNANVAEFVLLGLGCETMGLAALDSALEKSGRAVHSVHIQNLGGTVEAVEAGVRVVAELLPKANDVRRSSQPLSKLILGTECGGSDALSGVTANPALGWAADELVRHGGTAILSETPEIYGAEHLLTQRAKNESVARALLDRITWWERHLAAFGTNMNSNLALGNLEGGLTTILEKSLGAAAKGGTTVLNRVYKYAEQVDEKGFVFMDTPGYDPMSVTGLVAGGANVVVFTTGRGSVFGCKPVPSVKVASSADLYEHMSGDMDINAGTILEGSTVEAVGRTIFEEIIAVASGKKTKSELHGMGDAEFVPWFIGPVL